MKLFQRGQRAGAIYVSRYEDEAVRIAVDNLALDVQQVCGVYPQVVHMMTDDVRIVVGTLALMPWPAEISTRALQDENGQWRWEGFVQKMHEGRLYLAGCDRRGAVYAVYDLCERIGVSPWYEMADVPVKQQDVIELPDDWHWADWPGVTYRGIFINDEEELDEWARLRGGEETIGPKTYRKVFELILRLKGNFIWPAMHVNAFNMDPENGRLAQRMGIVTGTSHCDMLHRSNQNEWKPWKRAHHCEDAQYDYTIPGENRDQLLAYWRGSLQQNRENEAIFTIGMRGIHDSGFETCYLDGGKTLTPAELMDRKRALLEEIFAVQRQLIREEIPREHVPQCFVPYKEVLPIYDSGLQVPDDVTLIWTNDNYGHVRRYPDAKERQRSGGHGLYYHSSYWSPPGMSYLFMASAPLSQMGNELKKCWEQGIRRLWVDNVGAIKPLEQDMTYFLHCGWEAGKTGDVIPDARSFLQAWIDRTFTGGHGERAAYLYSNFARLNDLCRPEFMRSMTFSQTAYGDEAAARLDAMQGCVTMMQDICRQLPEEEQAAFFQLLLMKMEAAYAISASYYYADRSVQAWEEGAMLAADEYAEESRRIDGLRREVMHYYNHIMLEGKWQGILTPDEFPPPTLEGFPACKPALQPGTGGIKLRLPQCGQWGKDGLVFDALEKGWRYFEVLNLGAGDTDYTLTATEGIRLRSTQGTVYTINRVMVQVEESFREGEIVVSSGETRLVVPVRQQHWQEQVDKDTLREINGVVHLPATYASWRGFRTVRDLSHEWTCSPDSILEAGPDTSPEKPAWMHFTFHTCTQAAPKMEIIRFLTLSSTGSIRMRVSVDGGEWMPLHSDTLDEHRGGWKQAVLSSGEKMYLRLPPMQPGVHSLKLEALDPYVTIHALNLYLWPRQACHAGPGALNSFLYFRNHWQPTWRTRDWQQPRVIIAGDEHWQQDMVYHRNQLMRPGKPGQRISWMERRGVKNVPAHLHGGVARMQNGRIALEAENVLCQTEHAYLTPDAQGLCWEHRQAVTNGWTGLAMWVPRWKTELNAQNPGPCMHYSLYVSEAGYASLWLLVKYDDEIGFHCRVLMDGRELKDGDYARRCCFHSYRTAFQWCWLKLGKVYVRAGQHVLTLQAQASNMAVDRIYLTLGSEIPPMDDQWIETR